MNNRTRIGIWLESQRQARKATIEELSLAVGCLPSELEAIEAGSKRPSIRAAQSLARFFNVPGSQQPAFILFAISDLEEDQDVDAMVGQRDLEAPWLIHPEPPNNLPGQLTSFIGRQTEVDSIVGLLADPSIRLLNLVGPPGIGKTRLSIKAAGRLLGTFGDGVYFVALAAVSQSDYVASAIAQKLLPLRDTRQDPLQALKQALSEADILLVIDNCEHLIGAGPVLAELLSFCPGMKMLLTSRQALRLQGEQLFPVPPLSVPISSDDISPVSLTEWAGIELFIERARAVQPGLKIEEAEMKSIAAICRRLEGLPLAIELAAAHALVLSPSEILARLENRLKLLTGGSSDAPARHHTMREAIAWSYELLTEYEKSIFKSLSVYAGGIAFEEAERGLLPDKQAALAGEESVTSLLFSLVSKNMLKREELSDGRVRLGMLETIREYGVEQLRISGSEASARQAHAYHMVRLSENWAGNLAGAARESWLQKLDEEQDNLRAAFSWCISEHEDHEGALRLAGALHWYWYFRSLVVEDRKCLEGAIRIAPDPSLVMSVIKDNKVETITYQSDDSDHVCSVAVEVLARAYRAFGALAEYFINREQALPYLEAACALNMQLAGQKEMAYTLMPIARIKAYWGDAECEILAQRAVTIFRQSLDRWGLAYALDIFGDIAWVLGNLTRAIELKKEAFAIYEALGDRNLSAYALGQVSLMVIQLGDLATARAGLQKSALASREQGNTWNVAVALRGLGMIAHLEGSFDQAETHYRESVFLYSEIGDRQRMAGSIRALAHALMRSGRYEKALLQYREALNISRELGRESDGTLALLGIASFCAQFGDYATAAKLVGAALQGREASFSIMSSVDLEHFRHTVSVLSKHLTKAEYARLTKAGCASSYSDAVALSETVSSLLSAASAEQKPAPLTKGATQHQLGLSKREVELLRLVAQGLSNEEIASQLVVTANTVRSHLYHIFPKINVSSRSAATRFAIDNGLT